MKRGEKLRKWRNNKLKNIDHNFFELRREMKGMLNGNSFVNKKNRGFRTTWT